MPEESPEEKKYDSVMIPKVSIGEEIPGKTTGEKTELGAQQIENDFISERQKNKQLVEDATKKFEETCFGVWAFNPSSSNQNDSALPNMKRTGRICKGISVVKVRNEEDIDESLMSPVSGVRIVIVQSFSPYEKSPARPIATEDTPKQSLTNLAIKRLESFKQFTVDSQEILKDEQKRKQLISTCKSMATSQLEFSKKVFDKIIKPDYFLSSAQFAKRVVISRYVHLKGFFEDIFEKK
eukprot:Sdes_comp18535_c0_seq1m8596